MSLDLVRDAIDQAVSNLSFRTKAFIDGQFVDARSGKTFATENPATGKTITEIAECEAGDVDLAVASARRAFEAGSWSNLKPSERKRTLLKFAELIEANANELALLDTLEAGKPIKDCTAIDLPETVDCIRWHAEVCDKLYDHISPSGPLPSRAHPTRAGRGGGGGHPLEFPGADGRLETGTGLGHRQQRGPQAGRADVAQRVANG